MPGHIFISHASKDDPFVKELRIALESLKLPVWADSHNLRGGNKLKPEIDKVETCRQHVSTDYRRTAIISNTAGVIINVCGAASLVMNASHISRARSACKWPKSTKRRRPTSMNALVCYKYNLCKKTKTFSHGNGTDTEKAFHFRGSSAFVGDKYFLVPARPGLCLCQTKFEAGIMSIIGCKLLISNPNSASQRGKSRPMSGSPPLARQLAITTCTNSSSA